MNSEKSQNLETTINEGIEQKISNYRVINFQIKRKNMNPLELNYMGFEQKSCRMCPGEAYYPKNHRNSDQRVTYDKEIFTLPSVCCKLPIFDRARRMKKPRRFEAKLNPTLLDPVLFNYFNRVISGKKLGMTVIKPGARNLYRQLNQNNDQENSTELTDLTDLTLTNESIENNTSRPWSKNDYFKLFLDPIEGNQATLLAVKIELTYTNLFTNQTHNLHECRFIGEKKEGEQWIVDQIKSIWDPIVPSSDATIREIIYNVTMNFAPSKSTCQFLKSSIQLQRSLLIGLDLHDHNVKVLLRFSHPTNWRDPDTQNALRSLYNLEVYLHVLSADDVLNEMKVDGIEDIEIESDSNFNVDKRLSWRAPILNSNIVPPELVSELDSLIESPDHRLNWAPEDKYQKWLTKQLFYVLEVCSDEVKELTSANEQSI